MVSQCVRYQLGALTLPDSFFFNCSREHKIGNEIIAVRTKPNIHLLLPLPK